MSDTNKWGVRPGQVWKDNDPRLNDRVFQVTNVDPDYYPGGRVDCSLVGVPKKGQRQVFSVRLDRFNGTLRGYSMVKDEKGELVVDVLQTKKKKKKRKRGKS